MVTVKVKVMVSCIEAMVTVRVEATVSWMEALVSVSGGPGECGLAFAVMAPTVHLP